MASVPLATYSFDEYLELELRVEERHEFHAGQILVMAGGTKRHSRLAVRCTSLLESKLGNRCEVYESSMKLYIPDYDLCVYPDAMVVCGEPQVWNGNDQVVLNPNLIVEVLSPSTADYDRSSKLYYYQGIASVTDCLLIEQNRMGVSHSHRVSSNEWRTRQHTGLNDSFAACGCTISLHEIYTGLLPTPDVT